VQPGAEVSSESGVANDGAERPRKKMKTSVSNSTVLFESSVAENGAGPSTGSVCKRPRKILKLMDTSVSASSESSVTKDSSSSLSKRRRKNTQINIREPQAVEKSIKPPVCEVGEDNTPRM